MTDTGPQLHPLRGTGSTPLWLQLKHALRDYVTFDLQPGDKIPSESELCDHYDLSRITVRQAISALVDEGFLQKKQGRGTFVLAPRLAEPLTDPEHFLLSGFDAADPRSIRVYSAETVPAPDWIIAKLGLRAGDNVHKIRKVLSDDGQPVAFRTTFVPAGIAPKLLQADLSQPIYAVIEKLYDVEAVEADEVIEFIVADGFRADMLHVAVGHPLILVERIIYSDSGEALECSRAYYRADRFRLRHRLRRADSKAGHPHRQLATEIATVNADA
ncbi:GntR family transcriptional regulator [Microvirga subterranea]|uniref:GntR family transcriptional regulator n=1 Tax=Microvirga subterranea TaxID=186651 RepID=A0A370HMD4_9HYPH|nr:GntR family transcriptional regulator [Microvirga subterranea]RDI59597.1 GntR family transcriptional regulator [Microvirga subterranea]